MAVGRITGQMLSATLNRVTSDLTIRSTGEANLIQVDTSNQRVGIATASPTVPFEVTGAMKGSTTITANTLALGTGSITDSTGAISFGNENLTTTGQINTSGVRLLENEITTIRSNDDLILSANGSGGVQIEGSLTVSADLTVNGSTTTVNSTTVTIDDPIFTWFKRHHGARWQSQVREFMRLDVEHYKREQFWRCKCPNNGLLGNYIPNRLPKCHICNTWKINKTKRNLIYHC